MSSKMKELSKKLTKSDGNLNNNDLLNFFNEFLTWLNSGFNKTRPLPKSQVQKFFMMSIPLLKDINLEIFVNLIPTVLKILAILIHPQTDKDIREMVWKYSISLIDSKTLFVSYNSWTHLIDSAFSTKERDPNFNSGTPSIYSYESNSILLTNYLNVITGMCINNPNLAHDFASIRKKVIYHWELISELIFPHIFNPSADNRKILNQLCIQILQCINICQKKFKFAFFDTEIGGSQMISYLLDVLLRIDEISANDPTDEQSFRLLYKFCKYTFPCQIFAIGQNSIPYECKKNLQIMERITPIINRNYLFLSMNNTNNNNPTNVNNNSNLNNDNNNISNSPSNKSYSNRPKFLINPLLLCCFDAIPSDEVIALLKGMSQNYQNFSAVLINSIFIMINMTYPLIIKIQSKIKNINENLIANLAGNYNSNNDNNINNTSNLKIIDQTYRNFTNSPTNISTISLVADLFSHIMRLRSLIQVVIKSSIDAQTFSAIVSLFYNIQKKEMYPFLVTVFFTILFDRRYIDIKEERDYILLLMSFKSNMSYMPNLFSRLASQISVALSTFILNIPENSSCDIQTNAILFDDKEIVNDSLLEIGKNTSDNLFFFYPFNTNEFSLKSAKDFLTNMILSFDPLFNNYISMSIAGAIIAIIDWFKKKEKDKMNEQLQQQQVQQQQILNMGLKFNLRKKKIRPKSHDFQQIKFSNIRSPSEYKKVSSSLILPTVINEESSSETIRNSNPEIQIKRNLINSDEAKSLSNSGGNISLEASSPLSSGNVDDDNLDSNPNFNLKNEDEANSIFADITYDNSFYVNNLLFLKELDLSYLFGYLLPYLMRSLAKALDANNKEALDEINKHFNYFNTWRESKQFQTETQENERESEQDQQQKQEKDVKSQALKKQQLICFRLIYKIIQLAFECNLLTDKLARDWCRLLVMYINYSTKVLKEAPTNEVVLAIIECVLNGYPLSFSLIPVLSQSFCKVDFASFQDHEKLKIINYLVSVCSMIKKTIDKSKISFDTNDDKSKSSSNSKKNKNDDAKCNFIDVRADTFAVLTHASENFEGVSESIDAAAFSLFIDDLYSSDENLFDLTETLVFARLAQFEKKPSLTFSRLLIALLPTHLDLVMKKCSNVLFNRLIEVPFNVLLKLEVRSTEIYENLSQCLVDIILTLQNGPIFNKTLAFITIETVPDENQKILSDRTKFLIANFNKPNGVIDISINNNNSNSNNSNSNSNSDQSTNETQIKQKHSYYAISQNGAFYCVKNVSKDEELISEAAKSSTLAEQNNDTIGTGHFIVESSLPLGSSRYKITPSSFLTVSQKHKQNKSTPKIKKNPLPIKNIPERPKSIPCLPPKANFSPNTYMFSQVPSSALLFKVLSHFSQSTLKFSTTLKSTGRPQSVGGNECQAINAQNSFSAVPKPPKLLVNDSYNNDSNSLNSDSYPISGYFEEKSTSRSKSMNNISIQKGDFSDQKISAYMRKIFKRSQRTKQIIGVVYMAKEQVLNLNADYCVFSDFFNSDKQAEANKEETNNKNKNKSNSSDNNNDSSKSNDNNDSNDSNGNNNNSSNNNNNNDKNNINTDEANSNNISSGGEDKNSKLSNNSSLDDVENCMADATEDKLSFITQTPWKDTSKEFKEFMSSLGSFQRRIKLGSKKQSNNNNSNSSKDENCTDMGNEFINIHYVDFHSDSIFLISSFLGIHSFLDSKAPTTTTTTTTTNDSISEAPNSQESYNNNCRIKSNLWRILKTCHVLIIWNEDNTKFRISDTNGHNIMRAFIVISPIRNNLFKVSLIEHFNQKRLQLQQSAYLDQYLTTFPNSAARLNELIKMASGPLFGDTIVPKRSLGELVRATAIYEDRKIRSLIEIKEKEEFNMEHVIKEVERKKKGKKNVNIPFYDMKNPKKKKKKTSPSNEEIFSELWDYFPQSFSFFY